MTCIAGLVDGGDVWIGGDSAGVGGYALTVRRDDKVFRVGPFMFGFTTSFRMGQLLHWSFVPPDHDPRCEMEQYMVGPFIDAVRKCLQAGGWASKNSEQEVGGTFLVGYAGRLFRIDSDYQVGEALDGFDACGCGEDFARGALFATMGCPDPDKRLAIALQAAERMCAGVRGPFQIEQLPGEKPPAKARKAKR